MAENSKIEWTHHTFNPWWGCVRVSPACKHCYAETWAKRVGESGLWGKSGKRRFMSDNHWKQPIKWNKSAEAKGVRSRVFCASMADIFEDRHDLSQERERVWRLIELTPHLDWLLLTKRIEIVDRLSPWGSKWPDNVWLGTTVEDQRRAEERLKYLLDSPAKIKFLSCEPLLGKLDIRNWINGIDWVIAGGESGAKARPTNPEWLRSLRDQVVSANKAFHFKQWGDWFPVSEAGHQFRSVEKMKSENQIITMARIGKKKAGRILDGETWDELPSLIGC